MRHYSYLLLHVLILAGPVFASFDTKLRFFTRWRRTGVPIVAIGSAFLIWDMIFTALGVWGFSPDFVMGFYVINLPIEEVMFFISVPFAVLFLYEVACYYRLSVHIPQFCYHGLGIFLIAAAAAFYEKTYTVTVVTLSLILLSTPFSKRKSAHIAVTYLLHLPGFLIINGILTSFPIVWYNPSHLSGFRLGTIPCEDLLYSYILVWGIIFLYDRLAITRRKS
jgi:lycopene cyclase domain-containing protein